MNPGLDPRPKTDVPPGKNKMILAVKAQGAAAEALAARRPELLAQIAEIKRFYGLREQRLEQLLLA